MVRKRAVDEGVDAVRMLGKVRGVAEALRLCSILAAAVAAAVAAAAAAGGGGGARSGIVAARAEEDVGT